MDNKHNKKMTCRDCDSTEFSLRDQFPYFTVICKQGHFNGKMLKVNASGQGIKPKDGKPKEDVPDDCIFFGKHRGEKWTEVPDDYLQFCAGKFDDGLAKDKVLLELKRRGL